jgi:hypothetical protein
MRTTRASCDALKGRAKARPQLSRKRRLSNLHHHSRFRIKHSFFPDELIRRAPTLATGASQLPVLAATHHARRAREDLRAGAAPAVQGGSKTPPRSRPAPWIRRSRSRAEPGTGAPQDLAKDRIWASASSEWRGRTPSVFHRAS